MTSAPTIVAIDGGAAGEAAVRWAVSRGATAGALELVNAVRAAERLDWLLVQEAFAALRRARQIVRERNPGREVSIRVTYLDLAEDLQDASERASLIVVGSAPPGPLASLVHAVLPLKLAGQTACGLVVVPIGWMPRSDGEVVVGWDDDRSSDEALHAAAAEATRLGTRLRIVHTWDLPPVDLLDQAASARLDEQARVAGERAVAECADVVRAENPALEVAVTASPHEPAAALAALSESAQLVVVGSHGKGAIADLLRGSVGDDLIRALHCPLWIVPPSAQPLNQSAGTRGRVSA